MSRRSTGSALKRWYVTVRAQDPDFPRVVIRKQLVVEATDARDAKTWAHHKLHEVAPGLLLMGFESVSDVAPNVINDFEDPTYRLAERLVDETEQHGSGREGRLRSNPNDTVHLYVWEDPAEGGLNWQWFGGVADDPQNIGFFRFGRYAGGYLPFGSLRGERGEKYRQKAHDAVKRTKEQYGVDVQLHLGEAPPSQMTPNTIPPKPSPPDMGALIDWTETTFEPGTPVKFRRAPDEDWDARAFDPARPMQGWTLLEWHHALPKGARAEVLGVTSLGVPAPITEHMGMVYVPAKIVDARDPYGNRIDDLIGLEGYFEESILEPLEDNWAKYQPTRGMGRHHLPRSQRPRVKPNRGRAHRGGAMDTRFGRTIEDPDAEGGSAVDAAMDRYEIFHDKAPIRIAELDHDLPTKWVKTGECLAVMYRTDKWRSDGDDEDYKHLHDSGDDKPYPLGKGVKFFEPASEAGKSTVSGRRRTTRSRTQKLPVAAPKAVTMLGYCLGFFVRRDDDEQIYELNPRGTWLFSSPSGNMLCVYSPRDGFLGAMAGGKLRVLKDGIDG